MIKASKTTNAYHRNMHKVMTASSRNAEVNIKRHLDNVSRIDSEKAEAEKSKNDSSKS